jgi:hypothetical protein
MHAIDLFTASLCLLCVCLCNSTRQSGRSIRDQLGRLIQSRHAQESARGRHDIGRAFGRRRRCQPNAATRADAGTLEQFVNVFQMMNFLPTWNTLFLGRVFALFEGYSKNMVK